MKHIEPPDTYNLSLYSCRWNHTQHKILESLPVESFADDTTRVELGWVLVVLKQSAIEKQKFVVRE